MSRLGRFLKALDFTVRVIAAYNLNDPSFSVSFKTQGRRSKVKPYS